MPSFIKDAIRLLKSKKESMEADAAAERRRIRADYNRGSGEEMGLEPPDIDPIDVVSLGAGIAGVAGKKLGTKLGKKLFKKAAGRASMRREALEWSKGQRGSYIDDIVRRTAKPRKLVEKDTRFKTINGLRNMVKDLEKGKK